MPQETFTVVTTWMLDSRRFLLVEGRLSGGVVRPFDRFRAVDTDLVAEVKGIENATPRSLQMGLLTLLFDKELAPEFSAGRRWLPLGGTAGQDVR
jgi:hypothetical protein